MRITGELGGGACANGIDCDAVYDTDTDDVLVRGRFVHEPVTSPDGEPLRLPTHEGLVRVKRSVYLRSQQ